MRAARDSWLNPVLSLLLCTAAGALCAWLRTPLPWMIGPLLAMAVCNFSGAQLRAPRPGRPIGQIVIGTALGLYFTPMVAREVVAYWDLLLLGALLAIGLGALSGLVIWRTTGVDRTTAFFASVPGGAAEMALLGERFGAKVDRIAFAQSLRILIVVLVVPPALTYAGAHGTDAYAPAAVSLDWGGLALLLGMGAAVAGVVTRAGVPNAFMFAPLCVAVAFTVSEVQFSSMPTVLSNAGQLLIGCALGSRFQQGFLQRMPRYAAGVLGSIAVALVLAALGAVALAWAYNLPIPTLILATAPGGLAEMCITAKVLQLGVPLVTAAHVTRLLVLLTMAAPVYRSARLLRSRDA